MKTYYLTLIETDLRIIIVITREFKLYQYRFLAF